MAVPDTTRAPDVAALVRHAAADLPDRLAVVEADGRGLTWAELDHEVDLLASGLGEHGVVAGHRVLLALGNRIEFVTTYLAVLRAQAVAVPVNPGTTADELRRVVEDAGARMVVVDPLAVDAARAAVATGEQGTDPRLVVVGSEVAPGEIEHAALRADQVRAVPPLQDPEKLAVLLYTGGTTGLPRAAMLTHRALLANVEQVASVEPPMIRADDVVLGVLPLFHVYGLGAVLGSVLRHRAKLVLAERFDREGTLDLIEDEACSVIPVAPPVFAAWRHVEALDERLGPVRMILSGSAPLPAEDVTELTTLAGVPVHQGYGLTEAAPVVTSTLLSVTDKPGSVGAPLPGIDLRLVDEDGRPLAVTEPDDLGEIQIRGANLFSGYWPDGVDGPDDGGWWSTGDVGFLDPDGDLHLVDRVKELVVVSGFNVYPSEVETVIEELPEVRHVAVVGAPDPDTGETVVAHVVPAPGVSVDAAAAAVQAACAERLAAYKRPTRVSVVDDLPQTFTGKVRKGMLRGEQRRRREGLI